MEGLLYTLSTKYELLIWFYIPVTKMLKILLQGIVFHMIVMLDSEKIVNLLYIMIREKIRVCIFLFC